MKKVIKEYISKFKQREKKLEKSLARTEALYSVSQSLIALETLTEVLQTITQNIAQALEIDRVDIYILNVEEEKIIDKISGGTHEIIENNSEELTEGITFQELWEGLTGWVLKNRQPAFSPKGSADPRESRRVQKRRKSTNTGDIIVVPLAYKQEIIGTLTAINQCDSNDLKEEDIKLLSAMANHAAVAIKNSRLFEQHRQEKKKFKMLFEIASDAIFIHDLAGTILEVNQIACEKLNYEKEKLITKKLKDIKNFRYIDQITEKMEKLKEKEQLIFETSYQQSEQVRYFEVNAKLINYEGQEAIISIARDITDRKIKELKLEKHATTDSLTGLLNRRTGFEFLVKQLNKSKESDHCLTVCFVDIDKLKNINDNYGHQKGDQLIITVSEVMKNNIRESDIVCRIGGDEFLIVFSGCKRAAAKNIWNRIEKEIEKINQNREQDYDIGVSYGLAEYNPSLDSSMKELIERADSEMYQKKRSIR